jgi:multimeric flavodoxin WrbA
MPRDAPGYCSGCFRCFNEGEEACPQAEKVQAVARSMEDSDIIIIDSPTYCLNITSQLKTLFDHFAYMWLSHRPREAMFSKVAIVVSTTAGAGANKVSKELAKQLFWLGVPKIYRYGKKVNASSWEMVPEKIKYEIERETGRIAAKAGSAAGKAGPGLRMKFMFHVMRLNQKRNDWNMTDRNHWKEKGWLDGKKPWK